MWEVIRRVLKSGGDINERRRPRQGAAGRTSPSSASTAATTSTVGTYTLDPTTHSVIKREMGVFEYKGGKVTPKAFFGIGGSRLQGRPDRPLRRKELARRSLGSRARHQRRSRSSPSTASSVAPPTACSGVGFALILGVTGRFHFAYGVHVHARRLPGRSRSRSASACRSGSPCVARHRASSRSFGCGHRAVRLPPARRADAGATALLAVFVASLGIGIAGENLIRLFWGCASQA